MENMTLPQTWQKPSPIQVTNWPKMGKKAYTNFIFVKNFCKPLFPLWPEARTPAPNVVHFSFASEKMKKQQKNRGSKWTRKNCGE